jgi:hypothetical protein
MSPGHPDELGEDGIAPEPVLPHRPVPPRNVLSKPAKPPIPARQEKRAQRPLMPQPREIGPDTPLLLANAAKLAFPDGSITANSLRREGKRGRLTIENIAGKDYITLGNPKSETATSECENAVLGSSETARDDRARAALLKDRRGAEEKRSARASSSAWRLVPDTITSCAAPARCDARQPDSARRKGNPRSGHAHRQIHSNGPLP